MNFKLWEWQKILCSQLARCAEERGVRLLIHAPPEWGKSSIVSRSFPAWLLGRDPLHKVGLACFNLSRAAEFGSLVTELMRSHDYAHLFPDSGARIPDLTRSDKFTTLARAGLVDTQVSFIALGMQTGLVSRGTDTLICDDVYSSAEEAYSPVINDTRWHWWQRTVSPRIDVSTNVVVMFHRYHDGDLIGRIQAEDGLIGDGGKWQMLRFPAFADENLDGTDPTGREVGEILSAKQILTEEETYNWLLERKAKDPLTFMCQFQGDPSDARGLYFKADWFDIIDVEPACSMYARGWDVAFTIDGGDYTAGAKVGVDMFGNLVILDVWRDRVTGFDMQKQIVRCSLDDGPGCAVGVEDSANTKHLISILEQPEIMFQMPLQTVSVHGRSKWERSQKYAGMCGRNKVKLLRGAWNHDFIREHTRFRNKKTDTDDQIDAVVIAMEALGTVLGTIMEEAETPVVPGSLAYYDRLGKINNVSNANTGTYWFD